MTALGVGGPVLGHAWDPRALGVGLLGVVVGVLLAFRAVPSATRRAVSVTAGVVALVVASFTIGVFSDPVIVDGRVLVDSSKQAKSARLSARIYDDLRRMATFDDMLVADMATARANVADYEPAVAALVSLSRDYKQMASGDVPDPVLLPIVDLMSTAAYWEAKAMENKTALIAQEDARAAADLESNRATFTQAWLEAGRQLQNAAVVLNIPVTPDTEGPHE